MTVRAARPDDVDWLLGRESSRRRDGLTVARKMRRMRLDRITRLVEGWTAGERDKLAALLTKLNASLHRSLAEA